jgi:hypothetical protein
VVRHLRDKEFSVRVLAVSKRLGTEVGDDRQERRLRDRIVRRAARSL